MGRLLIVDEVVEHSAAVMLAWYPRMMGGHAIAKAVFREYNPGGRLPISLPLDEAQLPVYYNTYMPRGNYINMESTPSNSFGYGLSYTSFAYSKLTLSKEEMKSDEEQVVSAKVNSTRKIAGNEVVQLYLSDEIASIGRPYLELRGFKRIHLKPEEEQVVPFNLDKEELGLYNQKNEFVVEPGQFTVSVGGDLDALLDIESVWRDQIVPSF